MVWIWRFLEVEIQVQSQKLRTNVSAELVRNEQWSKHGVNSV
jgi:hypothetical protein